MIMKIEKPTKTLKTCKNCRNHKIKCDSVTKLPLPCSYCTKRNLECKLDIVNAIPNRVDTDLLESLHEEIDGLRQAVDALIDHKNQLLNTIIQQNPSIYEIQNCIEIPDRSDDIIIDDDYIHSDEFTISHEKHKISISLDTAKIYFKNYQNHYHSFLPILPEQFYQSDLEDIYRDYNLLFWCIILTSSLNLNMSLNRKLTPFIKTLVVENCWLKTPRSVYILASLLILTTWPLDDDNLAIKILSLVKNLSLQLGLHRLEFINEFSHKTNINISKEPNLNNLIRERLYKFVTMNTTYWLINKGLLYLNFNGYQEDYIINKASTNFQTEAAQSVTVPDSNSKPQNDEDNYINILLKISLVQQRLNENLNCSNQTTKLINFNMFEVILNDFCKKYVPNANIKMSIEYSKLQLYCYALQSNLGLNLYDYKCIIYKCLASCYEIINIFGSQFNLPLQCLPIHYKFIIEFISLIMLRVFYSPLLNSVEDYETLKLNFNKVYKLLMISKSSRLLNIIETFNDLFSGNLHNLIGFSRSFYLINKFGDHQNCNIQYEIVWLIYNFKNRKLDSNLSLKDIGLRPEMIDYLSSLSIL